MPRPKGQTLTQKDIVEAAIACLHKEGEFALGGFALSQDEIIHAARMFNTTLHGFVLADKAGLFLF